MEVHSNTIAEVIVFFLFLVSLGLVITRRSHSNTTFGHFLNFSEDEIRTRAIGMRGMDANHYAGVTPSSQSIDEPIKCCYI